MDTEKETKQISIAFINDKSPIVDAISKDLLTYGFEILFKLESIEDGIAQLSELKTLPQACIIVLDFYEKNILKQLQELRTKYPALKLIAHSDIDEEETIKIILAIGFASYLLIGSDADDLKKAIDPIVVS